MSRTLQLGCGVSKWDGAIGVDINHESDADVICDLNTRGYPFADNQFDLIVCEHVLEHLNDVIVTMEEVHRVGKPGARVLVRVPHFSSVDFYSDPTHKHAFGLHSFDYFIEGKPARRFRYSSAEYHLLKAWFPPPQNAGMLRRVAFHLINRHKDWYEKHLAFILPRHLLEFQLEIVKV